MLEVSSGTRKKLEGAIEGAFKNLFSLIPPFSIVLGAWDGYQSARLEELVEELSKAIDLIHKEKIDSAYIKSEEFYDLIQKCFKIRLHHRSKLKARFIVSLISESVRTDRNSRFDTTIKERFLSMIDAMTGLSIL